MNFFKNKKNLILSIFIILAVAMVVAYLLQSETYKNIIAERKMTFEEKINVIKLDNQIKLKEAKPIDFAKVNPPAVYFTLKKDDCEKIPANDRSVCLEELLFIDILNNKKIDKCKELNYFKDECFYKLGEVNDYKYCLEILDEKRRDTCLSGNANFHNDKNICKQIAEEEEAEECIDRFIALNNGDQFADRIGDIENCKSIKTREYFNQCILRSGGDCRVFADSVLVNKCLSYRGFAPIINGENVKNCRLLPDEQYLKVCEAYFGNKKEWMDSDGDGLLDNQELWFALDPFKSDNPWKEKGYMSNIAYTQDKYPKLFIDSDGDGVRDIDEEKK
ncbi:hypothetical protein L6270_02790 [Candidatus Parcubacteria bacterium]|nr:hypothetical protein [Patescibacteria group bacterium]MBU4308887.1 hypothetical protein [Patescibacteria group bacterium]MBU4432726.1 hypothetical protein [Patescibacteria group bacterium]MBU4577247.1 hypothetical protein [Patescibacteria group bacterium]MCG2696938.1 hypothetical protein [Candidatus Parcubacteria bacterium]